ncbi:nucleotidyltransferase family protein [Neobacillus sp. D3-1R]|uniref:nucleotidyltransferase family protein n=1 Tax=Neobacillus sp. D3-1R TaxID=3445778 RepID=UPI003F9FACDD
MSFHFLQALYNPEIPLPKDQNSYHELLSNEDFISIAPQVHQLLNQQNRLNQTPLFFQKVMKEKFNETFYQNLFIKNQTLQILLKLEEEKVEVIPLKGVFFSERYFGHLGARSTSDIDLLIKPSDLERVKTLVKSLGYIDGEEYIPDHFHYSFSKKLPGSPIPLTVELHWDLVKENTAELNVTEFWDQATFINSSHYIKELSHYHTFYLMCLHAWRHNLDSPRHYLDIVQLIEVLHKEIDYKKLISDSRSHLTYKRIIRTLSFVYERFPHLNRVKPFSYKNQKYYLREKEHNNNRSKYADYIDYQFLSYDSLKHSLVEVKNWLLPSGYEITTQIGKQEKEKVYISQLISLYKKRFSKVPKLFN